MKYGKLTEDKKIIPGSVVSKKELIALHNDVSFPKLPGKEIELTDDILEYIGYAEVLPAVYDPNLKHTSNLVYSDEEIFINENGKYQRKITLVPCSSAEAFKRYTRKTKEVYDKITKILADTDYTQLSDSPVASIFSKYRTELRDVLNSKEDPYLKVLPTPPVITVDSADLYSKKIQTFINNTVTGLGYDSVDRIAVYLVEGNEYYEQCKAISIWIGLVWKYAIKAQEDILNGVRPQITPDELINELPLLVL